MFGSAADVPEIQAAFRWLLGRLDERRAGGMIAVAPSWYDFADQTGMNDRPLGSPLVLGEPRFVGNVLGQIASRVAFAGFVTPLAVVDAAWTPADDAVLDASRLSETFRWTVDRLQVADYVDGPSRVFIGVGVATAGST